MKPGRMRRMGALIAATAALASLTVAVIAAPVSASDTTCVGKEATIVGSNKSEVIRGTDGNDIIVALGGNDTIRGRGGSDIICGGTGRDKLIGNKGGDKLFGGPGNDRIEGGLGRDNCSQGPGTGTKVSCELPSRGPAPTPTPEPKSAFQTTCEDAGGAYFETCEGTANTPVCEFSPPIGTPEPWNSLFETLSAVCPPGGTGFGGSPFTDPNWMGCSPPR